MIFGLAVNPVFRAFRQTAENTEEVFHQMEFPPFEALSNPEKFGYAKPSADQREKAQRIIDSTPRVHRPLDIAQSFIDRYYLCDPKSISQWGKEEPWNPMIVEFFTATSKPANNDMIPWCAAFANWCLERAGHIGSRSSSSQKFISRYFKQIQDGEPGDLAIFTCYDKCDGKTLGIGHVAFLKERLTDNRIRVVGGNQKKDKEYYSIISEKVFATTCVDVTRRIGDKEVDCVMKLNTYIRIA
jgi:uncharacterized protein (TIGR02594 family)